MKTRTPSSWLVSSKFAAITIIKVNNKALRRCEDAMVHAADYAAWKEEAREHDRLSGAADWREQTESSEYDYRLIQARLEELRALRRRGEVARLVFCLHEGLHGNLGNIASPALYSQCRFGTKRLLTEYLDEIAVALDYLCDYEPPAFPPADKLRFFERTAQSFGRSALMLSGGATLGLFHLGVIKAVWSEGLMPRVISGSSAGSIAGAMLGTHTDTELARISCSMADQSYSGDITIVPPTWPSNLLNVFSNPQPGPDRRVHSDWRAGDLA